MAIIDLTKTNERDFRAHVCTHLWNQLDPIAPPITPGAPEVKIGRYRLDLLARNQAGGLSIIEFKVVAGLDVLGQALLYPRALKRSIEKAGGTAPPIRLVFVMPYLDRGVVDAVRDLGTALPTPVLLRVCEPDGRGGTILRDPARENTNEDHCWHQDEWGPSQVSCADGQVLVRGEPI